MLHGNRTYLLQDANGQIIETHSISAGLDYPGVGPEHAYLKDIGRAEYVGITDDEALAAFHRLCRTEGIIPALESSHAVAHAMKLAPTMRHRPAPAGQSLRPRRQGHRHRGRPVRRGVLLPAIVQGQSVKGAARREGSGNEPHRRHLRRAARARGRKALIPYVTAGDPYADATVEDHAGDGRGGADVIELGVPFSDPMADGPVIQQAGERALARGIGMPQVLGMVRAFREQRHDDAGRADGLRQPDRALRCRAHSLRDAAAAGVDGVLVVDYPPEECEAFAALLKARGIDPIFLLAPTSTDARIRQVGAHRHGLRLLRVAEGRDRRRPPRHRCGRRSGAAHPGAREGAGRRRFRHPRRGDGAAP